MKNKAILTLIVLALFSGSGFGADSENQQQNIESAIGDVPQIGELFDVLDKATEKEEDKEWSTPVKMAVVFAILAILPSLLVMTTSFTRIVIVLAFARRAIGTQTIPPTIAIIGLALFLTIFTMAPTFSQMNEQSIQPYLSEEINFDTACVNASESLKEFMLVHVRQSDLELFIDMSKTTPPENINQLGMYVVIPSFIISEFRTAFEMGCLIFIPFLIIDLAVASVLLSAGMMMLPPVMISLPLKLILFILVDGWSMLAKSLSVGFG